MPVFKWEPFKNIATLQNRINRLFDDAFPQAALGQEDLSEYAWRPLVDIYETDEGLALKIDLPGVDKEDVSVEVKDHLLVIHGTRPIETEITEEQYYRRERGCGSFQRTFSLRSAISPDQIKASFKNGVLTIQIPKPEAEKPRTIQVDVG